MLLAKTWEHEGSLVTTVWIIWTETEREWLSVTPKPSSLFPSSPLSGRKQATRFLKTRLKKWISLVALQLLKSKYIEQCVEVGKKWDLWNSNRFLKRSRTQMNISEQVPPAFCLLREFLARTQDIWYSVLMSRYSLRPAREPEVWEMQGKSSR